MLKAENLGRRFGSTWLFRGLDIDLQPGQCLCILGHNGSGKSTLLKVLAGLIAQSEGTVERPERNGLGYAALDLALYPQLTAQEHLNLFAQFRGLPLPGPSCLENVGLLNVETKPVGVFSTGMRARLKLALALFYEPDVLLLDEPTAALDDTGQALIRDIVEQQVKTRAVILATNLQSDRRYATHELELGN